MARESPTGRVELQGTASPAEMEGSRPRQKNARDPRGDTQQRKPRRRGSPASLDSTYNQYGVPDSPHPDPSQPRAPELDSTQLWELSGRYTPPELATGDERHQLATGDERHQLATGDERHEVAAYEYGQFGGQFGGQYAEAGPSQAGPSQAVPFQPVPSYVPQGHIANQIVPNSANRGQRKPRAPVQGHKGKGGKGKGKGRE